MTSLAAGTAILQLGLLGSWPEPTPFPPTPSQRQQGGLCTPHCPQHLTAGHPLSSSHGLSTRARCDVRLQVESEPHARQGAHAQRARAWAPRDIKFCQLGREARQNVKNTPKILHIRASYFANNGCCQCALTCTQPACHTTLASSPGSRT